MVVVPLRYFGLVASLLSSDPGLESESKMRWTADAILACTTAVDGVLIVLVVVVPQGDERRRRRLCSTHG